MSLLKSQHPDKRLAPHKDERGFSIWALVFSLLGHLIVFLIFFFFAAKDIKQNRSALQVWLQPAVTGEAKAKKEEEALKPDTSEKKTVVSLIKPSDTRPEQADYLAEQNMSAKVQTRAPLRAKEQESTESLAVKKQRQGQKGQGQPHSTARLGKKLKKNKHDPLGIKPHFVEEEGADAKAMPAGSDDYLPEVPEGKDSALNAWEWRHATFFNRIKSRIGEVWSPGQRISQDDPQGSLLGHQDRITVLEISIDRVGALKDVKIVKASGVPYLDDEALRSFKIAAPFLYPPGELFKGNEVFSFTFAFRLHIDRGFSLDINW